MKPIAALLCACLLGAGLWLAYEPRRAPLDQPLSQNVFSSISDRPLRVTVLGTSLTADYDWPERLETCAETALSVTKIAKGGAGSDWGERQLDLVSATEPDVVLVEFAINDADLRRGISLKKSHTHHRAILLHLRQHHPEAQIVLMTMNSAHGPRRYLLRPRLPAYYDLYQDLAHEFETGLLDLYPRWRALDKAARDQADGLHPSQASAARVILPALSTYLGVTLEEACAGIDHS